ncbi:hypothetical protein [Nonomuraea candida]|uniref:hypothetical protein n=1 Tax=Nonomuraea candida TaxID=359159 RepID=UPI0005BA8362|nr:hypothetical protein [Nonomuraea candida]
MLNDPATERRGRVLRIVAVLAGLLSLALAAVLMGLPGPFRTLDPVPGHAHDGEPSRRPVAALTAHPTASPRATGPSPSLAPPPPADPPPSTGLTASADPRPGGASAASAPPATPRATPTAASGRNAVPPSGSRVSPRQSLVIPPVAPSPARKPRLTVRRGRIVVPAPALTLGPDRLPPGLTDGNAVPGSGPAGKPAAGRGR